MSEQPFTNREILLMFEKLEGKLDLIYDQTKKTNGRLLKAEQQIDTLKEEHTKVKAYAAVISVIIGAVVTVGNFLIRIV